MLIFYCLFSIFFKKFEMWFSQRFLNFVKPHLKCKNRHNRKHNLNWISLLFLIGIIFGIQFRHFFAMIFIIFTFFFFYVFSGEQGKLSKSNVGETNILSSEETVLWTGKFSTKTKIIILFIVIIIFGFLLLFPFFFEIVLKNLISIVFYFASSLLK